MDHTITTLLEFDAHFSWEARPYDTIRKHAMEPDRAPKYYKSPTCEMTIVYNFIGL
jgi:hypothetical protein